ncbi:Uu.00g053460.m01.CDS01 [Anthostomella pinea]|uniref:Ribonuclease P protein subunit n=1 Tax=Anthostomella pinea TaxID=933095 RepID=A0AAI8VWG5_9PEZI|nr:Uu.00g053460.m01.CDS01 [Anthostomella pinea]
MAPKDEKQSLTHDLLSRAHSPDSTNRIYSEKIQHRPLFLKPSSPPPSNARDARRKARKDKQKRANALEPKPLSARQRRSLGFYYVPKTGQKYSIYEPLNKLWLGYIREILGNDVYAGGQSAGAKLSAADFHGAEVEVARSICPSRVGIRGIIIKDSKSTFEFITKHDKIKTVPKEGTVFRIDVPAQEAKEDQGLFSFEIYGEQFQLRSADRANKKFRAHYLDKL